VAVDDLLDDLIVIETNQRLVEAIGDLSEMQRLLLRMHYFDGWPIEEVADTLGLPLESALGLHDPAVDALRRALTDH